MRRYRHSWLISYDISNNTTRDGIARSLEARGSRLLYSLFEMPATPAMVDALLETIALDLGRDDHLFALPTCHKCHQSAIERPLGWSPTILVSGDR